MTRLSLRFRVFLFFGLLAIGGLAIAAGALALGWSRAEPPLPTAPFVTALIVFALLNTGLLLAVWLLFDENVAKPITRLSADLRMRAHSDVQETLDTDAAQYLGDLAPAAAALTAKAESSVEDTAAHIARETERLGTEHKRLAALLTESPVPTLLVNPAREIVLYDAQAACILAGIAPPRLKGPLSDYFDAGSLDAAFAASDQAETICQLWPIGSADRIDVRIKSLNGDGHILFFDPEATSSDDIAPRPLTFDFGLLVANSGDSVKDQPLSALCFVVLDLETTGLSVETDAIVQIGAVRVLNGALVPGEELSTYVDPGCPIPPASTRVHKVSDAHVANAPKIDEAGQQLHHFARDAVLVAHNAPFDIGLLKRHADDIGAAWDHPVLDTVLLSAVAFGVTEEHSLDALCERLNVQIAPEDRHTALGDARATAEALVKLLKMLEGQGYPTLSALQDDLDRHARRLYSAS